LAGHQTNGREFTSERSSEIEFPVLK